MNQGSKKYLTRVLAAMVSLFFTVNLSGYALKKDVNIKEITKKIFPSVVKVEAMNGMRKVATGVVIEESGYIVTTALVVPVGTDISVRTTDGEKYEAEFIGMDPVTHLALVKAGGKKWKTIEWEEKEELEPGSWVSVLSISPEDSPSVTEGIVSSIGQDKIRLNVLVIPGSSGSPVINEKGRMVGLIRGVYSGGTTFDVYRKDDVDKSVNQGSVSVSIVGTPVSGLAVAIPVDVVKKVTTEIKETGKVQRGWLGVSIIENQNDEIEVYDVAKESPAEKAGIKKGDIIVEFEGQKVTSTNMLAHKIRMHKPGDKVDVLIKREQETIKINVELDEYSKQNIIDEFKEKFPLLFSPKRIELRKFAEPKVWPFPFLEREGNYIGVYLEEINQELSKYFGVAKGTGLLVTKLVKQGPAERAGLKVGDVIIKADGKRIQTLREIEEIIKSKKENENIKLEIIRDKKSKLIEVTVEKEEKEFPKLSYLDYSRVEVAADARRRA